MNKNYISVLTFSNLVSHSIHYLKKKELGQSISDLLKLWHKVQHVIQCFQSSVVITGFCMFAGLILECCSVVWSDMIKQRFTSGRGGENLI